MSTTVVVGYTPGPLGPRILEAGITEARRRSAMLVVVNSTRGDALVDESYADEGQITEVEGLLDEAGIDYAIEHTMASDVAEEILSVARRSSADLIVVGVRRRSPVGKLVMGSVAQRVILESDCPVLAVKAPARP